VATTRMETETTKGTAHHLDHVPTLDDPHRAALEENPSKPKRLSSATFLAVFVRKALL
jgi:hypothetical protein